MQLSAARSKLTLASLKSRGCSCSPSSIREQLLVAKNVQEEVGVGLSAVSCVQLQAQEHKNMEYVGQQQKKTLEIAEKEKGEGKSE